MLTYVDVLQSAWVGDRLTLGQIAHNCDIAGSTLHDWKEKYSDIADALKKSKEIVDIGVENALLKRTKGYKVETRKMFKEDSNMNKYDYFTTGYADALKEAVPTRKGIFALYALLWSFPTRIWSIARSSWMRSMTTLGRQRPGN